jgi:hypothetical protein
MIAQPIDADATHVVITTNYPNFDQIKVVDNGHGMSVNRFRIAMMNSTRPDRRGSTPHNSLRTRYVWRIRFSHVL